MAESRAKACFCLSKARDDGMQRNAGVAGNVGDALAALRSELGGLKISALRQRARAAGAPTGDIEEACDAEEPKTAIIDLILSFEKLGEDPVATLRAELEGLKLSAIEQRSKAAGASEADIEEAHDADDAKAAMIDLVVAHSQPAAGGAPAQGRRRARRGTVPHDRLRGELRAMKTSALRKRAESCASAEQLEQADDAEDSRAALVELIVDSSSQEGTVEDQDALRASLGAMKTSQLRKQCTAAGVPEDAVEEADDADDSHAALVELLLALEQVDDGAGLRAELEGMRKGALRKRAVAAGVEESALEEADDAKDSKAALVSLLLQHEQRAGRPDAGAERVRSALQAGGETAADALASVLEHAMEVLEQLSADSPRKSRRVLRALLESVEDTSETVGGEWCDGVSRCGSVVLEDLASRVSAVEALMSSDVAADTVSIVSSLLDSLRECGSVAVQCESVLSVESGSGEAARLGSLECVRALSPARLESVSDSEASLFDVLTDHLCTAENALGCAEQESCLLALFTLGCRNGLRVVGRVEFLECAGSTAAASMCSLAAAARSGDMDAELRATAAGQMLFNHLCSEAVSKTAPEVRAPLDACWTHAAKPQFKAAATDFTADLSAKGIAHVLERQLLDQTGEDLTLGCGVVNLLCFFCFTQPTYAGCDTEQLFGGFLTLWRRVCPSPLPAEWWVSTCEEVDVTSVRLGALAVGASSAKTQDQAVLESASWIGPLLAELVHICKVNASAGLSARPTMSFVVFNSAPALMESAARIDSHAASLLDSGVVEALEYACVNGFSCVGYTTTAYAAGAVVALVGRNEGGKTLSRPTVNAVLDDFAGRFDPSKQNVHQPTAKLVVVARRIATIAIADANKTAMLQHDKLLGALVASLVLDDDNPRRGQQGADALQEVCAGVLHELALYGPGATKLRSHKPTMDALRVLVEVGTKESRERAAGALFELDEDARAIKPASNAEPSSSKPPPHIMVSYNWDHQHVILRVVAWLQAHGYLVWVDTEQMKGSTVDAMALAVEGSEVMLVGVSRAYKESSNCRMEAQYGLQKKKALIPLMMQEGYEADGWLGLLLGTSLWYALYGDTLESESAFEDRMSALAREIGSRGRADAVVTVVDYAPEPCPEADESEVAAALRSELETLRLRSLERRAVSEGVDADAVDDAMDADDPKASLISLIVVAVSTLGPADRLLQALQIGGEAAVDSLEPVLEHAIDVLEQVLVSSPRKSRKSVRELLESVEEISESFDAAFSDGLARCGLDRLEDLAPRASAVQGLVSDRGSAECVSIVSSLLASLRECGSVVAQCESVLDVESGSNEASRMDALECVRGLSPTGLGCVSESEASLFDVLKNHLCGDTENALSCEERLACWLSLFVLGCRNGVAVVTRVELLHPIIAALSASVVALVAVASVDIGNELHACCAASLCMMLVVEGATKVAADARAEFESCYLREMKEYLGTVAKVVTADACAKIISHALKLKVLEQQAQEGLSVASGALQMLGSFIDTSRGLVIPPEALFEGALTLLRRACPSPLPAEWWVSTCAEVNVTSVRLGCVYGFFSFQARSLDGATLESALWLGPALTEAVHICKINASAGLSARPSMSWVLVTCALMLVEVAAHVETHAASLIDSGVIEALDYACLNDFSFQGMSVSSYAAGAAVALVGRNEGGKTLSRSTVTTILDSFGGYFDPSDVRYTMFKPARFLVHVRRVATVAIADANKKIMLEQHDRLLDTLVAGLLLDDDNPRRTQDGADAVQEACAGVLHELTLFGPGAATMRSHEPAMHALRILADSGTKESRESAAGALFELDEETRAVKATASSDADAQSGSSKPPPHLMVSYNWDHQHVILRVVAWLQAHGYLVWVDTEQMKGSTVDAMALAVEGSEVMLIGVSRPYKESSNCRMEAQYGLQKKKALIPLMMQEGYEADGWLGLLLGTSLWYALYGDTLESESAFEDRMSALSREIGSRGRADAVVVEGEAPEPCPESDESEVATALRSELEAMRLRSLERRAVSDGVSADAIDDAMDADDPKASLISLIVEAVSSRGPMDRLVSVLAPGGDAAVDSLSTVLEHAMDVLEQLSVSSPRKSRKSVRELLESVEEMSEAVDATWCDGIARCGAGVLESLASRVSAVEGLVSERGSAECLSIVSSLLDSLRECGSVVVQAESVLSVESGVDEAARLGALECVRALSPARLESVSVSEASLFDVLKDYLCGSQSALSCEERLSCWLSLFVLGCRNGVSVVARVEVLESLGEATSAETTTLGAAAAEDMDGELRASCAAHVFVMGVAYMESGCKCPPEAAARAVVFPTVKAYLGVLSKALDDQSFARVIARAIKLRLLEPESAEDVSLGCGAASLMAWAGIMFPKGFEGFDTETIFGGACTLLRCVCPSPLPAEWWVSTCAELDVTSASLGTVIHFFHNARPLDPAVLEASSWLRPVLAHAVHICKVNASVDLSARPTMAFTPVGFAINLLETAARVESHAAPLRESSVLEALDYACHNDFSFLGSSISNYSAGALVALVGRNEGGKTLSRSSVFAVLDHFTLKLESGHVKVSNILPSGHRVTTVATADANKKAMLQHDKLLGSLVDGLLLDDDDPRRGQDGADALQEGCAGVLHELALYGPGATKLRSHKPTMDALRVLLEVGTKKSRERAAGALFELDEEARSTQRKASDADGQSSSSKPPHIMVSYNWDHQRVILRVVAWLQAHGYLVWVDTEQMKGSTVDAMALAVEGSEVMLIGVSRAYKESSNCRMEGQYGLQKKKAMVPLKLTEGYEADGWLGLLLGTSLWYALYGDTLESESAFEDRMSALAREVGSRGRADAVATTDPAPEPSPEADGVPEDHQTLRAELAQLRPSVLKKRAKAAGAAAEDIEAADDAEDSKHAMISLIITREGSQMSVLASMKPSALKKRAKAAGAPDSEIEDADDADDAKAATISLILSYEQRASTEPSTRPQPAPEPAAASSTSDTSNDPVYRTLESHRLEHLFNKLQQMGVRRVEDLEQLTQADLGELKVTKFDRAKFMATFITQTPHHGTPKDSSTAQTGLRFEGGKHVMFSYQWDCQAEVQSVREHFAKLGIPTWMDTDGGMQVDIYDSMAQGVSNAAVVVAFMTQRYQDSENCKLELKYAKQKRIPIIPALMQGNGWRASEWLGVITAGALWTPLYKKATMQRNMQSLIDQIKAAVPTTTVTADVKPAPRLTAVAAGDSDAVLTLRSELDGLRQELANAVTQSAGEDDVTSRVLAPLPAEVPPLSLNLHLTPDMHKLKGMLLSSGEGDSTMSVTSQKSKVGALGMGGIGKTVTGSWLARDEDIRRHFEAIVWVTLGQTPDLARMQSLIYLQVTGEELSPESSPEQAKELITVAMRDKCVLLILDDVWEEPHEEALNFVDTSTASKTLVTTRIRGLGGGPQLELGLPSEAESVQLLLSSAGLGDLCSVPAEAAEVVQICGRLPLAVDLAGKMLRDLGVGGADWAGIPKLLRHEMRASSDGDETTVEYRVISASLNAIPLRDREDAKRVFSVFAFVAEDTHVPLSAFRILLSAVTGESELVAELQLRKWMQLLINRSIVLGTWERPQLHDIVREYAIALFSPEELKTLQQRVVETFARARPVSLNPDECGLRAWNIANMLGDPCCRYVNQHLHFHAEQALGLDPDTSRASEWLMCQPFDDLAKAVARAMGRKRLEAFVEQIGPDDHVLQVCCQRALVEEVQRTQGTAVAWAMKDALKAWYDHLNRAQVRPAAWTATQWDLCRLEVRLWTMKFLGGFAGLDEAERAQNVQRLRELARETEVGRSQPQIAEQIAWEMEGLPLYRAGNIDAADAYLLDKWQVKMKRASTSHGSSFSGLLGDLTGHFGGADPGIGDGTNCVKDSLPCLLRLPGWEWEVFGDDAELPAVMWAQNVATNLQDTLNGQESPVPFWTALRGNIAMANESIDAQLASIHKLIEGNSEVLSPDANERVFFPRDAACLLAPVLYMLERKADAVELLEKVGLTWASADAWADRHAAAVPKRLRARGVAGSLDAHHMHSAEGFSWIVKCTYVLCTTSRQVPASDVKAALPSPEQVEAYLRYTGTCRTWFASPLLLVAEVCERLEEYSDVLLYVTKVLSYEPSESDNRERADDMRPTTHGRANALHGRALAALGRMEEAEAAFEAAVGVSHRHGLWLLEMQALGDLKLHVLDKDGRGDEGTRRLKAVLQRMKGPAAELTKLLGDGLDAEEVLRS